MLRERIPDLAKCVEPDRVRREVYTDADIFELEMQRIHETVWIYCGHLSQIPKSGDYYTVQIGRQPMIMVRKGDGGVAVLYNRCPHRGNMIVGDMKGNTGEFFRCSYHAWTFHQDGKLKNIPMMESGYQGTRYGKDSPDCNMKPAARVEVYRGFVFASLALKTVLRSRNSSARASSRSTTCAIARRKVKSRSSRTASASSSTRTGSCSWRTRSTRCTLQ